MTHVAAVCVMRQVLEKLGNGVELRQYESYVVAETQISAASMRAGSGKGFQTVAGYIFGKNKPKSKMAMTAPVRTCLKSDERCASIDEMKVSFVMASGRTISELPVPLESGVQLRTVKAHRMACRRFKVRM